MAQHLYIITGASRGMGLAMAEQLLSAEHMLLCISRHRNEALTSRADTLGCPLEQWPMDLEHGVEAAAQLAQWLESRAAGSFASATLINNAGVLPQIAPLSASDPRDLAHALRVGLEAPLAIIAAFLRAIEPWHVPRKVLNISSGLAPGVIDTDMQLELRGTDASAFPDQKTFFNLKLNGQLTAPTQAASRVLSYLARPDFGNNPIGDVRE